MAKKRPAEDADDTATQDEALDAATVFGEPLDPIERIQQELRDSGAEEVRVKVSLVAPGKGKVYCGMLPPINVEQIGEVSELVAQNFGGSGEGGHFACEFRVGGKFAGVGAMVIAGDPFPARRAPPSIPHANPMHVGGTAPPVAPQVDEAQRLRRALKRRRKENEELARKIEDLRRAVETRQAAPQAVATNPVDDAIKLMKQGERTGDPIVTTLQTQLGEMKKALEDERLERHKERVETREREAKSESRSLRKTIRILKRKFRRLEEGGAEESEDPLNELLQWKLKIEKARAAGVDGSFLDRLTQRLDSKLGDKLLSFIEAQATNVLTPSAPTPPAPGAPPGSSKADDKAGFAKFIQGELLKGFVFVHDKNEVVAAVEKWPSLMARLASTTTREEIVAFCADLGFPRAMVETAFPQEKTAAFLEMLEALRKTLIAVAEDAKRSAEPPKPTNGAAPDAAKEGAK